MADWEYFELRHIYNRKQNFWYWSDTKTSSDANSRLDELREDGWELVSTYTVLTTVENTTYTSRIVYIFKRRLE